jgi:hypothetical protein
MFSINKARPRRPGKVPMLNRLTELFIEILRQYVQQLPGSAVGSGLNYVHLGTRWPSVLPS